MLAKPSDLKIKIFSKFYPNFIADSVLDIDFEYLAKNGVKAALIDLDGTVVSRGTYEVSPELSKRLKTQPLRLYIATNRPKGRDLKDLREKLNANGVIHPKGLVGKPLPGYYAQASGDHGLKPEEVVMIGDRYIQDIYGANLAGLRTIVVRKLDRPIGKIDSLLSSLERRRTDKLARVYHSVN